MLGFPTPDGAGNRIKLSPSGYLKAFLIVLAVLACIVIYVLHFDHFGKMLDTRYFLLLSLGIGLLIGIAIGHKYAKKEHDVVEQMRLYIFCTGVAIVFMPLFVALTNRYLDFKAPQSKMAQILELKASIGQPYGYVKGEEKIATRFKIVLLYEDEIYDIVTKKPAFLNYRPGDNIPIEIRSGLLGIRYFNF